VPSGRPKVPKVYPPPPREAKTLGQNIRRLRGDRTQDEVAEGADLDRAYYAAVELGLRNPSLRTLIKIARGLGVSVAAIVNGID
jgi:transcriptional regulator with XRE-family HTH domain